MVWNKVEVDMVRLAELHAQGLNNRELGRQLGVHHNVIKNRLIKLGLEGNHLRGKPPEPVDELHSKCSKCGKVVLNTDFPYVQGHADGRRLSYCRKCRYKQLRQAAGRNPIQFWKEKCADIKIRANQQEVAFNLTPEFLLAMWEKQEHKCFYTDILMEHSIAEGRKDNAPSIDRILYDAGYTQGNIVICATRVNTMKSNASLEEMKEWMPGWYQRLINGGFIE